MFSMNTQGKHENYEALNLIGYGLAKFDLSFVKSFGFATKATFYEHLIKMGVAETVGTVKNRQDLFDPFFDNKRKGWWQKGDAYIHRKIFIDSLFGTLDVSAYANVVRLYLREKFAADDEAERGISPIIKSKFRQLQVTGQEAELYFMNNYCRLDYWESAVLEDARTFGDGYDFQIEVQERFFLVEIKGLRGERGSIRMTQNEYDKAKVCGNDFALVVVCNLSGVPRMSVVFNPTDKIVFTAKTILTKQINYHTNSVGWL